ncbi:hypothetical protein KIPB_003406, partial [Kipferlia bialata]
FSRVVSWVDPIPVLKKLRHCLKKAPKIECIPHLERICTRLAQSMDNTQAHGVHLEALKVYEILLTRLTPCQVAAHLPLFAVGLFPVYAHAGIPVKGPYLQLMSNLLSTLQDPRAPKGTASLAARSFPGLVPAALAGLKEAPRRLTDPVRQASTKDARDILGLLMSGDPAFFFSNMWRCIGAMPSLRLQSLTYLTEYVEAVAGAAVTPTEYVEAVAGAAVTPTVTSDADFEESYEGSMGSIMDEASMGSVADREPRRRRGRGRARETRPSPAPTSPTSHLHSLFYPQPHCRIVSSLLTALEVTDDVAVVRKAVNLLILLPFQPMPVSPAAKAALAGGLLSLVRAQDASSLRKATIYIGQDFAYCAPYLLSAVHRIMAHKDRAHRQQVLVQSPAGRDVLLRPIALLRLILTGWEIGDMNDVALVNVPAFLYNRIVQVLLLYMGSVRSAEASAPESSVDASAIVSPAVHALLKRTKGNLLYRAVLRVIVYGAPRDPLAPYDPEGQPPNRVEHSEFNLPGCLFESDNGPLNNTGVDLLASVLDVIPPLHVSETEDASLFQALSQRGGERERDEELESFNPSVDGDNDSVVEDGETLEQERDELGLVEYDLPESAVESCLEVVASLLYRIHGMDASDPALPAHLSLCARLVRQSFPVSASAQGKELYLARYLCRPLTPVDIEYDMLADHMPHSLESGALQVALASVTRVVEECNGDTDCRGLSAVLTAFEGVVSSLHQGLYEAAKPEFSTLCSALSALRCLPACSLILAITTLCKGVDADIGPDAPCVSALLCLSLSPEETESYTEAEDASRLLFRVLSAGQTCLSGPVTRALLQALQDPTAAPVLTRSLLSVLPAPTHSLDTESEGAMSPTLTLGIMGPCVVTMLRAGQGESVFRTALSNDTLPYIMDPLLDMCHPILKICTARQRQMEPEAHRHRERVLYALKAFADIVRSLPLAVSQRVLSTKCVSDISRAVFHSACVMYHNGSGGRSPPTPCVPKFQTYGSLLLRLGAHIHSYCQSVQVDTEQTTFSSLGAQGASLVQVVCASALRSPSLSINCDALHAALRYSLAMAADTMGIALLDTAVSTLDAQLMYGHTSCSIDCKGTLTALTSCMSVIASLYAPSTLTLCLDCAIEAGAGSILHPIERAPKKSTERDSIGEEDSLGDGDSVETAPHLLQSLDLRWSELVVPIISGIAVGERAARKAGESGIRRNAFAAYPPQLEKIVGLAQNVSLPLSSVSISSAGHSILSAEGGERQTVRQQLPWLAERTGASPVDLFYGGYDSAAVYSFKKEREREGEAQGVEALTDGAMFCTSPPHLLLGPRLMRKTTATLVASHLIPAIPQQCLLSLMAGVVDPVIPPLLPPLALVAPSLMGSASVNGQEESSDAAAVATDVLTSISTSLAKVATIGGILTGSFIPGRQGERSNERGRADGREGCRISPGLAAGSVLQIIKTLPHSVGAPLLRKLLASSPGIVLLSIIADSVEDDPNAYTATETVFDIAANTDGSQLPWVSCLTDALGYGGTKGHRDISLSLVLSTAASLLTLDSVGVSRLCDRYRATPTSNVDPLVVALLNTERVLADVTPAHIVTFTAGVAASVYASILASDTSASLSSKEKERRRGDGEEDVVALSLCPSLLEVQAISHGIEAIFTKLNEKQESTPVPSLSLLHSCRGIIWSVLYSSSETKEGQRERDAAAQRAERETGSKSHRRDASRLTPAGGIGLTPTAVVPAARQPLLPLINQTWVGVAQIAGRKDGSFREKHSAFKILTTLLPSVAAASQPVTDCTLIRNRTASLSCGLPWSSAIDPSVVSADACLKMPPDAEAYVREAVTVALSVAGDYFSAAASGAEDAGEVSTDFRISMRVLHLATRLNVNQSRPMLHTAALQHSRALLSGGLVVLAQYMPLMRAATCYELRVESSTLVKLVTHIVTSRRESGSTTIPMLATMTYLALCAPPGRFSGGPDLHDSVKYVNDHVYLPPGKTERDSLASLPVLSHALSLFRALALRSEPQQLARYLPVVYSVLWTSLSRVSSKIRAAVAAKSYLSPQSVRLLVSCAAMVGHLVLFPAANPHVQAGGLYDASWLFLKDSHIATEQGDHRPMGAALSRIRVILEQYCTLMEIETPSDPSPVAVDHLEAEFPRYLRALPHIASYVEKLEASAFSSSLKPRPIGASPSPLGSSISLEDSAVWSNGHHPWTSLANGVPLQMGEDPLMLDRLALDEAGPGMLVLLQEVSILSCIHDSTV